MKMRCAYKSMLRGDVVKVGTVLDLTPAECELDVVKAFFTKVDEDVPAVNPAAGVGASPVQPKTIVVAGLTREEAVMKLQQAGQRVAANISDKRLAERFEEFFGTTVADK